MSNLQVFKHVDKHNPNFIMWYVGTPTMRYSYFYDTEGSAQYALEKGSFIPLPNPVLIYSKPKW